MMKLLYWNIRGLGNAESRLVLKKLCNHHKPHLVLIAEPWVEFSSISPSFWKSLGLKPFLFNDRNNRIPSIWCLCSDSLTPASLSVSVQHCTFSTLGKISRSSSLQSMPQQLIWAENSFGMNYPLFPRIFRVLGFSLETSMQS